MKEIRRSIVDGIEVVLLEDSGIIDAVVNNRVVDWVGKSLYSLLDEEGKLEFIRRAISKSKGIE